MTATLHKLSRKVEPTGDYRDFLHRRERKSREWAPFEPTCKQPGDLVLTSRGVEVHP